MTSHTTIDAYCHVGLPRFGTAEDALHILTQNHVQRAVFVLGPAVPDYPLLFAALHDYRQRVRGIGIPFGQTLDQIMESVELQLAAGVIGLRIQEPELLTHAPLLDRLGSAGRWIYAVNLTSHPAAMCALHGWLDRYPDARLAAPHFVANRPLFAGGEADEALRGLLAHPHFYPIFSRHGGVGSAQPYPHADLRPWVEQVIEQTGWERILWGSEYPVLFWRDETVAGCRDWLAALLPHLTAAQRAGFLGGNAARALFHAPPPAQTRPAVPEWVEAQFNRSRTVPIFPQGLHLPMGIYGRVHRRFAEALKTDPTLTFSRFVAMALDQATPDLSESPVH